MPLSDLQEVIEYYENEKRWLTASIREFLSDEEYLMAHYQSEGLSRIKHTLRILHGFQNPYYDRTELLTYQKESLEKAISKPGEHLLGIDQLKQWLTEIEAELLELTGKKYEQRPDRQEFDDAIFDIVEGRSQGFRLHLKKESHFWIDFRLQDRHFIKISITPVHAITEEYLLGNYQIDTIKNLGFDFDEATGILHYSYTITGFKTAFFIKTLVARIIFDVFYFKEFDNPSFMEYLA